MPARVANIASCIKQVTFKLVHYALLINQLPFGLTFDCLVNLPWPWLFRIAQKRHPIIVYFYIVSSASGQDESNSALWLATRERKMELPCPLGITRRVLYTEKLRRKVQEKLYVESKKTCCSCISDLLKSYEEWWLYLVVCLLLISSTNCTPLTR